MSLSVPSFSLGGHLALPQKVEHFAFFLCVFLAGHTVAMVTYYVMERTTTCSPIVGQWFDTMIVASSDKEWLQCPIEILVLETVLIYLN